MRRLEASSTGGVRAVCFALGALAAACALAPAASGSHPLAVGPIERPPAGKAPPPAAAGCPGQIDEAAFPSAERLLALNRRMYEFGPRPTATRNHSRFVDWLARKARAIPGVELRSQRYEVDRWLERTSRIFAGGPGSLTRIPDSGAVPYSKRTGKRGVKAQLVYVPEGEEISAEQAQGRIVIRDAIPGSIPNAAFNALAWSFYDPDLSLISMQLETYERDFLGYAGRIEDLHAAAAAGAAGVVFVHGFPREQVKGHYAPYEGERWKVPAIYTGADEGERLKQIAAAGGSARLRVSASRKMAPTRTVIATVPGQSPERIVIQSHTDGMNAIWDNGPPAMLPLAKYFASLPLECRPRTIEFAFTTAHLYQREGGAERYADELDRAYDEGTLALVMAMEHLGGRQYDAVPRADGGPGREIVLNPQGLSEPSAFFTGLSPLLVSEVGQAIQRRDIRRSILLRGADLPQLTIPPHHSFGGEGTSYENHLIPTVALVTGPWSLYNPAFGMEAIDPELMRRQALAFGDLTHRLASVPKELIAGGYLAERDVRELLCGIDPSGYGLVQCVE